MVQYDGFFKLRAKYLRIGHHERPTLAAPPTPKRKIPAQSSASLVAAKRSKTAEELALNWKKVLIRLPVVRVECQQTEALVPWAHRRALQVLAATPAVSPGSDFGRPPRPAPKNP